jgi:hypothetical protein
MTSLLTLAFWFNLRPGSMGATFRNLFIGFIITLIVLAVIFFISKKRKGLYRHFFSSLYDFCISNAFIGLLLLFFNYEIVPFFSAHFWNLLWLIAGIWWLLYILKDLKKISARKKQQSEVDEIKKYLP